MEMQSVRSTTSSGEVVSASIAQLSPPARGSWLREVSHLIDGTTEYNLTLPRCNDTSVDCPLYRERFGDKFYPGVLSSLRTIQQAISPDSATFGASRLIFDAWAHGSSDLPELGPCNTGGSLWRLDFSSDGWAFKCGDTGRKIGLDVPLVARDFKAPETPQACRAYVESASIPGGLWIRDYLAVVPAANAASLTVNFAKASSKSGQSTCRRKAQDVDALISTIDANSMKDAGLCLRSLPTFDNAPHSIDFRDLAKLMHLSVEGRDVQENKVALQEISLKPIWYPRYQYRLEVSNIEEWSCESSSPEGVAILTCNRSSELGSITLADIQTIVGKVTLEVPFRVSEPGTCVQ